MPRKDDALPTAAKLPLISGEISGFPALVEVESSGWQQEMEEKRDEMADQTLLPQIEKQTAIAIF